jgi:hypothetical protein
VTRARDDWERWYFALKQQQPDAYRKAIEYTEAVTLNFRVAQKAAGAYECAAVLLACDLLGVKP